MQVFFRDDMSVDSGGYSPSAKKPAQCVADWQKRGLDIEIVSEFEAATIEDLALAHDRKFAEKVLAGQKSNGHGNCIPEVTQSCRVTVGSLVAASRAAFENRIVCSPTSGFHHAGHGYNGAFCTFNGLIVAARTVINEGLCSKVAILDCDQHYGDGTEDIIETLELTDTVKHWTYGGHRFDRGAEGQKELLVEIDAFLTKSAADGAGLLIYQAGADPHINDPLGGQMTDAQLKARDRFVFDRCMELGLPVVWNFAGGYQRTKAGKITPVLAIHRATAKEAIAVLANEAATR
jgi:acetoin utilization deacetylase AcuC-like enzyme